MPPTLKDIAIRLHLSPSTVSRALNNKGAEYISETTRAMVIDTAREMGYRPNLLARALTSNKTNLVALFVPRFQSAHYTHVIRHMEKSMEAHGQEMVIREVRLGADVVERLLFPVDGAILCDVGAHILTSLTQKGIPFVGMGTDYPFPHTIDQVNIAVQEVSAAVMDHLFTQGCRRIAHLTYATALGDRSRVYAQAMQDAGYAPEFIVSEDQLLPTVRATLRQYLQTTGVPEAIFCHNDSTAIAAYRALRDLGYRIPDDVALAGFDGVEEMAYFDPPITTVIQPVAAMCEEACRMLAQRIAQPECERQYRELAPELIIRASSQRSPSHAAGC